MKQKLWLFILILCMPVVSATITVNNIHGTAGIEGFRASQDTITAVVASTTPDVTMAGLDVCTGGLVGSIYSYTCSLSDETSTDTTYQFASSTETTTKTIRLDNTAPSVTFSVEQEANNLVITYQASDASPCSGLTSISVIINGNVAFSDVITGCQASDTIIVDDFTSGEQSITIEVSDAMGNIFTTSPTVLTADVDAPVISNLQLTRTNDEPLGGVSYNSVFKVNIHFTITDSSLAEASADLSGLEFTQGMTVATCIPEEDHFNCVILSKQLQLSNPEISIPITASDEEGNEITTTLTTSLTIDNAIPSLGNLQIGTCDEQLCYVRDGNNQVTITLSSDGKTYNNRQVYYSINGNRYQVSNCEENICTGTANIQCSDGQALRLALAHGSVDDAGNPISADQEQLVRCDNQIPSFIDVTYESDDPYGLTITGSQVTIKARVQEANSLNASLNTSYLHNLEVLETDCVLVENDEQECTWIISITREGNFVANLEYSFSDATGNTIIYEENLPVLGISSETPNYFTLNIKNHKILPKKVSRITLGLLLHQGLSQPVYIPYDVQATASGVKLVHQEITSCLYEYERRQYEEDDILSFEVQDPTLDYSNENRFNARFVGLTTRELDDLPNTFNAVCNVSLYTQKTDTYYETPQIITIKIPFELRESSLASPGDRFVQKIKTAEGSTWNHLDWIDQVDKIAGTLQQLCNVQSYLNYAQTIGVSVGVMGDAANAIAPPTGEGAAKGGRGVAKSFEDLTGILFGYKEEDGLYTNGLLGEACDFMSCQIFDGFDPSKHLDQSIAQDAQSYQQTELPGLLQSGNVLQNLGESDLQNSLVMSTLRMCVPGMLYNINKFRQENCEYISCLKEYSVRGLDVSYCEQLHEAKQCQFIVGEVFELPFVRLGKNLFTNINDMIRNIGPVALWSVLDKGVCKESEFAGRYVDDGREDKFYACSVPRAIYQTVDYQRRSKVATGFRYDQIPNYCAVANCVGPDCHAQGNALFDFEIANLGEVGGELVVRQNEYTTLYNDAYNAQIAAESSTATSDDRANAARAKDHLSDFINSYNRELDTGLLTTIDQGSSAEQIRNAYNQARNTIPGRTESERDQPNNPREESGEGPWSTWNDALGDYTIPGEGSYVNVNGHMYIMENNNWRPLTDAEKTAAEARLGGTRTFASPSTQNYRDISDYQASINDVMNGFDDVTHVNGDIEKNNQQRAQNAINKYVNDLQSYYSTPDRPLPDIFLKDGDDGEKIAKSNDEIKALIQQALNDETDTFDGEVRAAMNGFAGAVDNAVIRAQKIDKLRKADEAINVITRFLLQQFQLDQYLTSDYWFEQWGFQEGLDVISYTDPDQWKASMCNPNAGNYVDQPAGAVYTCGETCHLVMGFGAERVPYNDTHYVYTIIAYLGPVEEDIKYKIELRGERTVNVDSREWASLGSGKTASISFAIPSSTSYTSICVVFEEDFPPSDVHQQNEYCRDIPESAFVTGNPYVAEPVYTGSEGGAGFTRNPEI